MMSGRPEYNTVITGTPASLAFLITVTSGRTEAQILLVAVTFGVRRFSDHDDNRVRTLGAGTVSRECYLDIRYGLLDGREKGSAAAGHLAESSPAN